jgi:hypothetical protein
MILMTIFCVLKEALLMKKIIPGIPWLELIFVTAKLLTRPLMSLLSSTSKSFLPDIVTKAISFRTAPQSEKANRSHALAAKHHFKTMPRFSVAPVQPSLLALTA